MRLEVATLIVQAAAAVGTLTALGVNIHLVRENIAYMRVSRSHLEDQRILDRERLAEAVAKIEDDEERKRFEDWLLASLPPG